MGTALLQEATTEGREGKYRIKLFKMASRVKHMNMRTYGATQI